MSTRQPRSKTKLRPAPFEAMHGPRTRDQQRIEDLEEALANAADALMRTRQALGLIIASAAQNAEQEDCARKAEQAALAVLFKPITEKW